MAPLFIYKYIFISLMRSKQNRSHNCATLTPLYIFGRCDSITLSWPPGRYFILLTIKDTHRYCASQYSPVCKEHRQYMNVDRSHLVQIMKHKRVSEDVRRPRQRSICNTKHQQKQAGMIRCQPTHYKQNFKQQTTHTQYEEYNISQPTHTLLLLVCVSWAITGQPRNSIFIRRV